MEIKQIATDVRKNFEAGTVPKEELERLYFQYNQAVGDVRNFVRHAIEIFPALNCGLATVFLAEKLSKGRPANGTYGDYNHTFLLLEDNTVIDITADQYGGPPVYVGPLQSPCSRTPIF